MRRRRLRCWRSVAAAPPGGVAVGQRHRRGVRRRAPARRARAARSPTARRCRWRGTPPPARRRRGRRGRPRSGRIASSSRTRVCAYGREAPWRGADRLALEGVVLASSRPARRGGRRGGGRAAAAAAAVDLLEAEQDHVMLSRPPASLAAAISSRPALLEVGHRAPARAARRARGSSRSGRPSTAGRRRRRARRTSRRRPARRAPARARG